VVPPYDVAVAAGQSDGAPVVFAGVTRADPRLALTERSLGRAAPPPQSIRLCATLPPCAETSCWLTVASSSRSGQGATAQSLVSGTRTVDIELEHTWVRDASPSEETLDVHVLVGDDGYSRFAYAHLRDVLAGPSRAIDLGMVEPRPTGVTLPRAVTAYGAMFQDRWDWNIALSLDLPSGGSLDFQYVDGSALITRLPLLEGATLRASAWAQHPRPELRPYAHRSSHATVAALPVSGGEVLIELPAGPDLLRPEPDRALSRHASSIGWADGAAALVTVTLADLERKRQRFRVHTNGAQVSFARLEALGVPRPQPGAHVLDVTATRGGSVDELASPEPASTDGVASSRSATYQRFAFTVTP
jgi:hypothetical protein